MSMMMWKMWHHRNELALRTQLQLRDSLQPMTTVSARLGKGQGGATIVEYAILVSIISIAAITVIILIGDRLENMFERVNAAFN
jgi:Flp pilus assembly pilin Flp